ncbi:MAG TPA: PilZ domain-containing protein [Blastocatellia bacterium]|nr:PilZ domain-containing protein [Blastocatellia bacterium]
MSAFCDRCNEQTNQILKIANLPEVAAVAHLGYRQVCAPCYDDLVQEALEVGEQDEDRRSESRVKVAFKARVEGNTSHLDPFSEEMNVVEISPSGLRLQTAREIESGALLKVSVPSHDVEVAALVEWVTSDDGQRSAGLKLVDPDEGWEKLWQQHASPE